MTQPKSKPTQRSVEDDILASAHSFATSIHQATAMDDTTMREMDRLCLPSRPEYDASDVQRIRSATHMSQPVFARLLGVDKSAVAQ
jgi:putative transcriptional regulator